MIVTPEGIQYRVLWLPDNPRMLPQTLEKLYALIRAGATVIGDAPHGLATLSDAVAAQQRFETAVENIWGKTPKRGIRPIEKGAIVSGMTIDEALSELNIQSDVSGGEALWMHRSIDGADWYYVCAPKGGGFSGTLDFRSTGHVEIWDPLTGTITAAEARRNGNRSLVTLDLPQAGSCFVVFRKNSKSATTNLNGATLNEVELETRNPKLILLTSPWTLAFPDGWGAPSTLRVTALKAWKDLDVSDEAKAFSGTVAYTTTFDADEIKPEMCFSLDLGRVEIIAAVSLNGKPLRTLWTPPYRLDITEAIQSGVNTLTVEVTGTWFNRLVYDAGQPEDQRKTWTIAGPEKDEMLRESGLLGPVSITTWMSLIE